MRILTGIFEGGRDDAQQLQSADVEQALDHQQTVSVGHEQNVSYETADGSTQTWSNSQELTLTVGLDATLGATAYGAQGAMSDDGF